MNKDQFEEKTWLNTEKLSEQVWLSEWPVGEKEKKTWIFLLKDKIWKTVGGVLRFDEESEPEYAVNPWDLI